MIEVRLSNGDSAEAETPEAAVYAAVTLMREAADHGASLRLLRATFDTGARVVRDEVRYQDLTPLLGSVAS